MPRRLFDSEYIFGLHDPGGEQLMLNTNRPGWVLFTEELGHNPNDFRGRDYQYYSNRNLGVISRLNNGYHPNGTLPASQHYADFAQRCANFVANSRGCKIWIIGNEMNRAVERPSIFTQALPPALMPEDGESSSGLTVQPLRPLQLAQDFASQLTKTFLRTISGGMGSAALYVEAPSPPPPAAATTPLPNTSTADPFLRGAPGRFSALRFASQADDQPVATQGPSTSGEVITPELYARCYQLCRTAIHAIPGHADDQVLLGAVAPWNNQTRYPTNPTGDWLQYFQDLLRLVSATGCDGITLHTYTHGSDPGLISDERRMEPPFQTRRYHFRAYQDFMALIPAAMRHLPVYITETDQGEPWLDSNQGWVQRAYAEINAWNQQPGNQQIRALILYRWPNLDRWAITTKAGVIDDFRAALLHDYRWRGNLPSTPTVNQGDLLETLDGANIGRTPGLTNKPGNDSTFGIGEFVVTTTAVNVRRAPGFANKAANDLLAAFEPRTTLNILAGPQPVDGLDWWRVGGITLSSGAVIGWVAERTPGGEALFAHAPKLSGTKIPDRAANCYLGLPFRGSFGIFQLWGENPQIYGRISYDGVPLKGHNGIDFLTPTGTNVLAVDEGTVVEVVPNEPSGLGNYIKLNHPWGESVYAHLQACNVQPGQTVRRGQIIGRSDGTGFSSGPHLHFAIRIHPYDRRDGWGGYADPLPYLNPADIQLPAYVLDPPPVGLRRPQASPAMSMSRRALLDALGYAPDRAGVKRP